MLIGRYLQHLLLVTISFGATSAFALSGDEIQPHYYHVIKNKGASAWELIRFESYPVGSVAIIGLTGQFSRIDNTFSEAKNFPVIFSPKLNENQSYVLSFTKKGSLDEPVVHCNYHINYAGDADFSTKNADIHISGPCAYDDQEEGKLILVLQDNDSAQY